MLGQKLIPIQSIILGTKNISDITSSRPSCTNKCIAKLSDFSKCGLKENGARE
jgi:hypothetical protein